MLYMHNNIIMIIIIYNNLGSFKGFYKKQLARPRILLVDS